MTSKVPVHPAVDEVEKRRLSLDSLGARYALQRLQPEAAKKLTPWWLHSLLVLGGGFTGSEHLLLKCSILVGIFLNLLTACVDFWLLGVAFVPDIAGILGTGTVTVTICVAVRWQFLQSGVLWSLAAKLDIDGQILRAYNVKSRNLIFGVYAETTVVFGFFMLFGLHLDVSGRAAPLGEVVRACIWAANFFNVILLQPLIQFTIKLMPMLFFIVYELLVEDMRHFHSKAEALFAEDGDEERSVKDFLDKLQQHELGLRTRLAMVNDVLSRSLACFLSGILAMMSTCFVLAILTFKSGRAGAALITTFYIWVGFVMLTMMIILLRGAARVGDTWIQLVDDLNTPMICVRSAAVLHVPLAQRLQNLQNIGIRVWGRAITSSTVFSLASAMASGLGLALIGTLITSA